MGVSAATSPRRRLVCGGDVVSSRAHDNDKVKAVAIQGSAALAAVVTAK